MLLLLLSHLSQYLFCNFSFKNLVREFVKPICILDRLAGFTQLVSNLS